MCGIVAWITRTGDVESDVLQHVRDQMSHRGPDTSGIYVSEDRGVGLGFRRLSVIDLSPNANQPIQNEDGTMWLVFNGEVYNFREIRSDLEQLGHRFLSRADSEVVLHAYQEWGQACLERLIGMFAFVIWDARKRCVFAARDRLGIKPLYYAATSKRIFLASELKALVELPGFSKALDGAALYDYLRYGYIVSPRTIYAAARHLSPGHFLLWEYDSGKLEVRTYWEATQIYARSREQTYREVPTNEAECIEELDALLRNSVNCRLISDVPLGAFLSGGMDSSTVVALMRQVTNAEIKTFTIRFLEESYNEADKAAAIAQHLGTTHREMTVTAAEAQKVIPQLPSLFHEPFGDKSAIPTYLVSKMARQHVTVTLSGDGGDELFAGYNIYLWPARQGVLWSRLKAVRPFLRIMDELPIWSASAHKLLNVYSSSTATSMFDNLKTIWQNSEIRSIAPIVLDAASPRLSDEPDGAHLLDLCMLRDLQHYLPDDILTKLDRTSMAVSLEARVPLLDHRIVEFALGMPLYHKYRNGKSKYLLRRVLDRYVPAELTNRPKQGFSLPLDSWLKGDLRYLLQEYLSTEHVALYGVLRPSAVQKVTRRFLSGNDNGKWVWNLLMLQMWLESTFRGGRESVNIV